MSNNLDVLNKALFYPDNTAARLYWCKVHSVSPLMLVDREFGVPYYPSAVLPKETPEVGDRVLIARELSEVTVLGYSVLEDSRKPMFRAYVRSNNTINPNHFRSASMTVDYAYGGSWDGAPYTWVREVPKSGLYRLTANYTFSTDGNNQRVQVSIKKNTNDDYTGGSLLVKSRTQMSTSVTVTKPLLQGETVSVWIDHSSSTAIQVYGGSYHSYFEAEYLRPI